MGTEASARPSWIDDLDTPRAAAWIKVALQVNPFAYVRRHGHQCAYDTEDEYNAALVEALCQEGVRLVAITDHFRIDESLELKSVAEKRGIVVLPAFEACSSEGVHLLVLLREGVQAAEVNRLIWACQLHDPEVESPLSRLSCTALLQTLHDGGAICVAAHATQPNGILAHLSGHSRAVIWKDHLLKAAAIPGGIADVPEGMRRILENRDAVHERDRGIATINAGDISAPNAVGKPGSTCWMRMSTLTLGAVDQAFLDPESRIRLASDAVPDPRPVIRGIHWEGGFLDSQTLVLSDELNVLVGAPGAGKSTVIESLRAAFGQEAHSVRAQRDHDALCASTLVDTTISVVVEHPHPSPTVLVVQRTMPHPPVVVHADTWTISERKVADLVPAPEIYGQHEVADLARDRERRTALLERFVSPNSIDAEQLSSIEAKLTELGVQMDVAEASVEDLRAQVMALPGKEEQLAQWEEQGIAEQLAEETLLQREHRFIEQVENQMDELAESLQELRQTLPSATTPGDELSASTFLGRLTAAANELAASISVVEDVLDKGASDVAKHRSGVADVRAEWKRRRKDAETRLAEARQKLGAPDLASSYKALRDEVDGMHVLSKKLPEAVSALTALDAEWRALVLSQEQARAARANALRKAAASVSSRLGGRVRVTVETGEDFDAFDSFAREHLRGYRRQTTELFKADATFSLRALADAASAGEAALQKKWAMTDAQARLLVQLDASQRRELERLAPILSTEIELNVAVDGTERWRKLDDLSKGQRATAVLLLLLLDSEAPLVVDQPEDDLDNRFIVEEVVPALRRSKRRRQFMLSTHNANVPVLADADLVAGLTAEGDASNQGAARFEDRHLGSIDKDTVKDLIESQLEGGHDAFEERARRYGITL